ncbi:MAG: lipoate--protein ligase family protein [Pirellulales bacterium]
MHLLDVTLPTPAENLALDEALLEDAEADRGPSCVLRLWESPQLAVILGRSCRYATETNVELCRARKIPILRRASGGGSVVIGPGCLMYTVLLPYTYHPRLQMIEVAHEFVLGKIREAILNALVIAPGPASQSLGAASVAWRGEAVTQRGTSDLALGDYKFSGNSLRCKRTHLLYHGTLLYDFPLETVGELLAAPPREPEYRGGRPHGDFIRNLPFDPAAVRRSLADIWQASNPYADWPSRFTQELVAQRYSLDAWNLRL